ncbi:MAG: hypothetical protein JKY03_01125 [Aureispira sp.]|nr:hypothetical protein [Aureispira sp.]
MQDSSNLETLDLLDDEQPLLANIIGAQIDILKQKCPFIITAQIVFSLLGVFLFSNSIILYAFTYGTYFMEHHLLQFFLFMIGGCLLYMVKCLYSYNSLIQKTHTTRTINNFKALNRMDLKIWKAISFIGVFFFLAIIDIVIFVGILELDSMFWIFLDN